MDGPALHQPAPMKAIRDKRGIVIGRLEEKRLVGVTIARDARGVIIGTGNLLPALLVKP